MFIRKRYIKLPLEWPHDSHLFMTHNHLAIKTYWVIVLLISLMVIRVRPEFMTATYTIRVVNILHFMTVQYNSKLYFPDFTFLTKIHVSSILQSSDFLIIIIKIYRISGSKIPLWTSISKNLSSTIHPKPLFNHPFLSETPHDLHRTSLQLNVTSNITPNHQCRTPHS